MRIQQLHYIIKIVETGSMNEAAKQLFITQPSLSNAVRDLENEMGIDELSVAPGMILPLRKRIREAD